MEITQEEMNAQLNKLSKFKGKNERLSWKRKYDKLQEIITTQIQPLEEKILELVAEKQEIMDEIVVLRKQMIKECVHPVDYLVHNISYITCKFCNVNLSLPFSENMEKVETNG